MALFGNTYMQAETLPQNPLSWIVWLKVFCFSSLNTWQQMSKDKKGNKSVCDHARRAKNQYADRIIA